MTTRIPAKIKQQLIAHLGNKVAWIIRDNAPTSEERERAESERRTTVEALGRAEERREAKRRALLADPEYQVLVKEEMDLKRKRDTLTGTILRRKYRVGVNVSNLYLQVEAEGDTWDEVLKIVAERHPLRIEEKT